MSNPQEYHLEPLIDSETLDICNSRFAIRAGMPTAHSAPPLNKIIQSQEFYVWPDPLGEQRGQAIEPLHPGVVEAARLDAELYELLSLIDALRIGRTREQPIATQELSNRIA